MDKYKKSVLDKLDSILLFSGDDKTFKLGEWKAWRGSAGETDLEAAQRTMTDWVLKRRA